MKIYKAKDYADLSCKAANIVSAQVIMKPDCSLGLATGSTPIGIYKQLIKGYKKGDLDFSKVHSINLDEYQGLSGDAPQSYRYYMDHEFFSHINIKAKNTQLPNGLAKDAVLECQRYNKIIAQANGIDLQILGLGHNGHIGFNEPGEAFKSETHCVKLTKSTIDANAKYFDSPKSMPKFAYTMGIKSIMQSKKILLVVSGISKADALYKSFFGPITPQIPASILQLHPDVTIVADKKALSLIKEIK